MSNSHEFVRVPFISCPLSTLPLTDSVYSAARSGACVKHSAGGEFRAADKPRRRAAAAHSVARRRRPWQRRHASPGDALRLPRCRKVGRGDGRGSPADVKRPRTGRKDIIGGGHRRRIHSDDRGMSRMRRNVRKSDVTDSRRVWTASPPAVRHRSE